MENSIAVYILNKNISNGRTTFAQYMLISIACADILTALTYYPAIFVQFSHGGFIWLVEGPAGDILCKLYNFLAQIPSKVLVLSLVALACDATRNSSSQGRREHTKKFSIIVTTFFWVTAAGFSGIYFKISKVQTAFQFNECSTEPTSQQTMFLLSLVHSYVFVVTADLILTILSLVVFIRVKRRGKEMNRYGRHTDRGSPFATIRRQRRVGEAKNVQFIHDLQSTVEADQEIKSITSRESSEDDLTVQTSQPPSSSVGPEVLIEMSSVREDENILGKNEVTVTDLSTSVVNKSDKGDAKRKKRRQQKPCKGIDDVEGRDSVNVADQSAREERFDKTRKEAKIMGAVSLFFAILSITQLILPMVCPSCSEYVLYAVQIAVEIYAVIKPGIYASIDTEFRKRYRQLSPAACCCFRRIPCHTVQEVRMRH